MAQPQPSERTVLITGANRGIGYATAESLARLGDRVVLVSRDLQRGEAARAALMAATGSDRLEVLQGDMASMASIRRLTASFLSTHQRLDVLINNAGGYWPHREISADGLEMTFAVNVMAPFLLTSLLLDCLRQSAPARVVNVSSGAHSRASIDLTDLQHERRAYRGFRVYSESKLALTMLTAEFARRFSGSGVTFNSLHPGVVGSGFASGKGLLGLFWGVAKRFMLTPEAGAVTSVYLASAPEVANVTGSYFAKMQPAPVNPIAADTKLAEQLWTVLESLTRQGSEFTAH